jgi:anti-sigma factor RsiW
MSSHLNENRLERFRLRELSPEELLAADEHLSACEGCRLKLAGAAELRGMTAALRASLARAAADEAHLAYEQFEAYADGVLRGVELRAVETHLAACANCADEARDLLQLRETLHTDATRTVVTNTVKSNAPRASSSTEPAVRRRGLRETLAGFWNRPFGLSPQWAALAAALLLLASLSAWWLASKSQRAPEVAVHTPESSQPQSPAVPTPAPEVSVNTNSEPSQKTEPNRPNILDNDSRDSSDAAPLLALDDGARHVTVERGGVVRGLEELPSEYREQVRAALTARRLATPSALAEVRSGAGTLMGSAPGESFEVEGPAAVVARTDRPLFRWHPLAGAEGYVVRVYESDFNLVATSPQLNVNEWRPTTPLPRGRAYAWQVTAKKGGVETVAPAPEARFKILGQAEEQELTRAERDFAGSHLTLGVLYTRAGLLAEAEAEFAALLRANPRSDAARKLLRNVRELREGKR